ncbi:uncharacterized protein EKO05_0007824 [Ascochyta rabiei]|uniref:uncharacterized protein n=1 Tax=Didymella rabiei TaxID=5454 RepID=UPI002200A40E|nr:uncharacterized protein EKO05_0007824 [Ascochyta rabiei]UPX17472.1 hypothetical protein EKO05_0007824 [Ascochyta rabiei]
MARFVSTCSTRLFEHCRRRISTTWRLFAVPLRVPQPRPPFCHAALSDPTSQIVDTVCTTVRSLTNTS